MIYLHSGQKHFIIINGLFKTIRSTC